MTPIKTKMQERINNMDLDRMVEKFDSLKNKGELLLEVQLGDWFYLSDGVQVKLKNFENGYIKVAIKATDDIHILRHELYEALKKKRELYHE